MNSLPTTELDQLKSMTNQLNNHLQQISGYAQRCAPFVKSVPVARTYLENMVDSAAQAGDVAQALLEYLYALDTIRETGVAAAGEVAPVTREEPKPAPPEPVQIGQPAPPAMPLEMPVARKAPGSDPVIRLRTSDTPAVIETSPVSEVAKPAPPEKKVEPIIPADLPVENPGGPNELIMLVDDDEHVLLLAKMILVEAGYRILAANNGLEAMKLYESAPEAINLVILDYAMPIMDGSEVFEELRAINPQALVLLSSGFTEQSKLNQMLARGLRGFLPKPYTREKMLLQVRSAIDGSRA